MPDNIHVAALSDVGAVRSNNEDSFAIDPRSGLFVVCDGMGGLAAGEVASRLAADTMIDVYAAQPPETKLETRLSVSIKASNAAVLRAGLQQGQQGMGTTLVAAAIRGHELVIANLGDSRAYISQQHKWRQITTDHSYVNELIRLGSILPDQRNSPELKRFASVITRAIGVAEVAEPDFFHLKLHAGDVVMLVSDGLTRYLDTAHFTALVDPNDLEVSCQRLIDAAKSAGGVDNITCMLLRCAK